jgi:hypothetical protein
MQKARPALVRVTAADRYDSRDVVISKIGSCRVTVGDLMRMACRTEAAFGDSRSIFPVSQEVDCFYCCRQERLFVFADVQLSSLNRISRRRSVNDARKDIRPR